jgi:hypothetical protein
MAGIRRKYWMFRPIIELGRFLAAIGLMRDKDGVVRGFVGWLEG